MVEEKKEEEAKAEDKNIAGIRLQNNYLQPPGNFSSFLKQKKLLREQGIRVGKIPTLAKFLMARDIRHVQLYVQTVVSKFDKYIKAIAIGGSAKTGTGRKKSSDIDIPIIIDDTDVQRMTRMDLKEKLFQRLTEMAYPISKKIHPQPYLLTEFWEYVREGNPVIYNLVLRDSLIVYDTGFLLPMQMLMRMGSIRPSKEAVDKHMIISNDLIKLSEETMNHKICYNLEQAIVSSSQAVLMELGYRPPVPKETADFLEEYLVKEHKRLDMKYVHIARNMVKIYKDIEHKEKKEFTGEEYDKYRKEVAEFVEEMNKILKKIRKEKGESWLYEISEKKEPKRKTRESIVEEKEESAEEKAQELIEKGLGQR